MKNDIKVRKENNPSYKYSFVKNTLNDLKDWFSYEKAVYDYAKISKDLDTFIISKNNRDLGFCMVKESSKDTIDLYCIGILKNYHGRGLGKKLLTYVFDNYKDRFKLVQVKTLAPGVDSYYDKTIKFYEGLGFLKLEIILELWGEDDPCLIMVKSL